MLLFRRILGYLFAFNLSKRTFNSLLPGFARRKITSSLNLDTGPFNRPIDDLELVPIQTDSYLAVYFKRYGTDVGPGVSMYIFENEVLRFDCFGKGRGHYHSLPCLSPYPSRERIDMEADTIEGQIDQTAGEISRNYSAHLAKHFLSRIRNFKFDRAQLETAVAEACDKMLTAHRAESSTTPSPAPIVASRTDKAGHQSYS